MAEEGRAGNLEGRDWLEYDVSQTTQKERDAVEEGLCAFLEPIPRRNCVERPSDVASSLPR